MPRAIDPKAAPSPYYPELQLLSIDKQPVPELPKYRHRGLLALSVAAWRLYRARQRMKRDKALADGLREQILSSMEVLYKGLYGFRVFRKRALEVKVTDQHSDVVVDPAGFIEYLGLHAPQVINGITLPIEKIMASQENYDRVVRAVAKEFGDELAAEVGVTFNRDKLHELTTDGILPEIPEGLLERQVGSKQVRIKLLEAADHQS